MKKSDFDNLTCKIPYYAFHNKVCLLSDGSLFVGIKLDGLDTQSMTAYDLAAHKERFKNIFDHLPVGYVIQIYQDYHTDNKDNINELENNLQSKHPISNDFKESHLSGLKNDKYLKNVSLFMFVILPNKGKTRGLEGLISGIKQNIKSLKSGQPANTKEKNIVEVYKNRAEQLLLNTEGIIESLKSNLNIIGNILEEKELYKLVYKTLNPSKPFFLKDKKVTEQDVEQHKNYLYRYMTMRELLTHSGADEHSNYLVLDDKFITILTLKVPSSSTTINYSEDILINIDFPFCWSCNFTILDTAAKNNELKAIQRRKHAFMQSTENPNIDSAISKTEVEEALFDQKRDKFKWHDFSMSFMLIADSEDELKARSNRLCSIFRDFQESVIIEEKNAILDYFLASLPGCGHLNDRNFMLSSLNVSDIVPISVPPKGTQGLSSYFHTFRNTLFRFSTFSDEFNHWNHVVIGQTGAGKSFLVNSLLNMSLMSVDKPRVMILDLGQSFKRTTDLWGGDYLTIDLNNPDSGLNPLPPKEVLKKNNILDLDLMNFTVQLILLMTGFSAEKDKFHKRVVREVINHTYDRIENRTPILSDLHTSFRNYSKHSKDSVDINIARDLSKLLEDYVGDGPYSKLFNRESSLNITSDFFCFDFKSANQSDEIREIATYIIGGYIVRKITENSEPKHIIFDEFSTTMKHETGRSLCELISRNCRKHGGAFISISQQINDFKDNPASQTVFNQSTYKWFLKMDDALNKNKEHLKLNDNDVNHIQSLTALQGYYSEVYLIYEEMRARLRLTPDPLMYWGCTTDSRDKRLLEAYFNYYLGEKKLSILKELAAQYPHGVTNDMLKFNEIYKKVKAKEERGKLCA